jgi:hypothetical protein
VDDGGVRCAVYRYTGGGYELTYEERLR